jgi:hypothetical protein
MGGHWEGGGHMSAPKLGRDPVRVGREIVPEQGASAAVRAAGEQERRVGQRKIVRIKHDDFSKVAVHQSTYFQRPPPQRRPFAFRKPQNVSELRVTQPLSGIDKLRAHFAGSNIHDFNR